MRGRRHELEDDDEPSVDLMKAAPVDNEVVVYRDHPVPPTEPPAAPPDAGPLTCIRLNCALQGLPTASFRCPACDHPTQLGTSNRWPRSVRY